MFKKWHSYLFSLVSVCCILSMLFLDTCIVNAQITTTSILTSYNLTIPWNNTHFKYVVPAGYSGYTTSTGGVTGSISSTVISTNNGSFVHFHIPLNINGSFNGTPDTTETIGYVLYIASQSITAEDGTVLNLQLLDESGKTLCVGVGNGNNMQTQFGKLSDLWSANGTATKNFALDFDVSFNTYRDTANVNVSFSVNLYIIPASSSEISSIVVEDVGANQKLDDLNNTQESIKDTTEDTNSKITDFFSNFFSNLVGVFVPGSSYFSDWFTRVNNLLADKLGILYFPFDFIIDTLTTINSNSSTSSGQIIFPEMSFTNSATSETYTLLNRQVINLNDYDVPFTSSENSSLVGTTNFTSLLSIIRLFTGIAFTLALIHLFIDKLHLILRGSERG